MDEGDELWESEKSVLTAQPDDGQIIGQTKLFPLGIAICLGVKKLNLNTNVAGNHILTRIPLENQHV